jgi:hypothetical protein
MEIILKIKLVEDVSPEELSEIKFDIQDMIEDHDSGAVETTSWLEPNGTRINPTI